MTMNKIFAKLRKKNQGQYKLLGFCIFLSTFLVSSFSFMYFGPTVQEFLPQGGDTRKMASLLLAVTAVGCVIFTVYASTLFFRHKSREFGIFLALGEPKKALTRILFTELAQLTAASAFLGILLGLPASWLIWKLFESFLVSTSEMAYRFGITGMFVGLLFALVLAVILGIMGSIFVNRSDIMDILKAGQKTEMVKEVKSYTFPVGIILVILGILGGAGLNTLSVVMFHRSIPGTNFLYVLALIGIYWVLLSVVAQNRAGKKKQTFYKNMVSISLMRFSAKSTTRNMCVIVLLLFACMFSSFYGMLYTDTNGMENLENASAFALHYPAEEKQITKQDIFHTADQYDMDITNFAEDDAANLVISYKNVTYNEDTSKYVPQNSDQAKLALVISDKTYERLTGRQISVDSGTYQTIVPTDYKETVWEFRDGLYELTNPDTGKSMPLTYGGFVEYDTFSSMSSPFAYVLNNKDYQTMTKGISDQYMEHLVLFDVADYDGSYPFGKALLQAYTEHATDLSNHLGGYDAWEHKLSEEKGEVYELADSIELTTDNAMLLGDWKYAPAFTIVTTQDFMQLISVYVMLCLYIFIITLSAVAVMCYVRSISIAENNKALFDNLTKLGANASYRRAILKKQLSRIFQFPAALGCGLGFLFSLSICWINDRRFMTGEIRTLSIMLGITAFILAFMYVVYRASLKKSEGIIEL